MTNTPKKTRKTGKKIAKPYEPTPAERALVKRQKAERKPKIKVTVKNTKTGVSITPDHPDLGIGTALFMDALGTTDRMYFKALMVQVADTIGKGGEVNAERMNHALALICGIAPQGPIEGMLAAQMAAVHSATMTLARRVNNTETIMQQDSADRCFNRLARTFIAQLEALNRHRGKGQQKMTVEHVHVHEGGQAIVGTVQGGGGEEKTGEQPHAKATNT